LNKTFTLKFKGEKSYIIWFSVFFLFLLGSSGVAGQKKYTRLNHLTVDDGLSSNRIRCIYRDSKDYLWMGTDVGLDRYDSYQVKPYRHSERIQGTISSDILTCIYEDRQKKLWFGTYEGLNLYDPKSDKFKVFRHVSGSSSSLNSNVITGLVEDSKGVLWVVTDGSCLNRYDPATESFKKYPFEPLREGLSFRPSRMAALDSKGQIWVGSLSPGIICFNPESGKFTRYNDPDQYYNTFSYKSLYIDKEDKIWVGTDGIGLFSYDPKTSKFEHFGVTGHGNGTNLNFVLDIIPEDDRFLLLAVDQGGINRYDKLKKSFEYIMYDKTNDEGLNNNGIWCFHRDRQGILWIGTSGGGINYLNPVSERFRLFRHSSDNPKSLSYNFVGSMFEDHLGMIWVGTDGGGVNVYNPKTGKFEVFRHDPSDPYSISGNVIRGIAEDKDHNVWIGTWDAGLNMYDRKTGRFYRYMPDQGKSASISDKTIWNLLVDHNNTLWISIYNVGIDLFDVKTGKVIKRFRQDPDKPGSLSAHNNWFFYEDNDNNMWICTQNGLCLYNPHSDSFKVIHFPDNNIGAFYKDHKGYIWVGSNTKGLYVCNPDGTILKTYDDSNILPNNRIHAITQDNLGDIWISSNNGITRFNPDILGVRTYSKEDGLQGDQFYQQSFLKTRSGELYFGGYSGLNSFYPDSLPDNKNIPNVYITDFQIYNKPVVYAVPNAQFPTHISEAKEIKLRWNQSVISFSFAAINYIHPKKNQYSYIMEGFEKDWNYTDASRRYVSYTNLDPGEYTFRVRATNNDRVLNEKGTSLKIIILPPWWKSLWFRIIALIVIIAFILELFMARVRQLKKQKILLEESVARKTAELNELNASKDKFFSIIAHDLKNPFNTIIGFSEMMKESVKLNDSSTFYEYSVMINTAAVQTLRLLENLLEWANSQRGKLIFTPVPLNLHELVKDEFTVSEEMAIGKNIELCNDVEESMMVVADKNMIRTILRNLITNAIKFTHRDGKVIVSAGLFERHIEISVADSGIGMSQETMSRLFRLDANLSTRGTENEKGTGLGLFLCKEFVEKHGGKIWAVSKKDNGSVFIFTLPFL
jgi:signal transduction histidine kinase/ligand-binding sensor domain-containing protein